MTKYRQSAFMRTASILLAGACAALVLSTVLSACGSGSSSSTAVDNSPSGDIPDNQVFVTYQSSVGGYSLQYPEGWARNENGTNVTFSDKLHTITVELTPGGSAPTVDSVTNDTVPALRQQVDGFEQVEVKQVTLPSGAAVRLRYRANSAADAVTGKRTTLEVDRYETFKGKKAVLSLSAPQGSDNVDVWDQISRSFTWG